MKIATSSGDFYRFCQTDEERIRELHAAGFRYIDLDMYHFTEQSPLMGEGWRKEAERLRALADSLGMKFVQAHSQGGNPLSKDEAHVDFLMRATLRSIEVCEVLGIPCTVSHAGVDKNLTKDEWFSANKAFYEKLFPMAEKCGVRVLCENSTAKNMGGAYGKGGAYYINTGKDMKEFIDFVDHPLFGGCWDTGHANCEGAQYDEILALGEGLAAIHYNDNRGGGDEHLVPFFGTMNHDEVISALIDVGFSGTFTLECMSSLRPYDYWQGDRRRFEKESKLREPQLFMQRHMEKMMYETAEWMLRSYGVFEE